jgi:hypothetical protein
MQKFCYVKFDIKAKASRFEFKSTVQLINIKVVYIYCMWLVKRQIQYCRGVWGKPIMF